MNAPTASNQPVTAANVDLSNCGRELVQFSGAVQPHAALVTVTEPELRIVQVSSNTAEFFGIDAPAMLGRNLLELLGATQTEQVRQVLTRGLVANGVAVHMLRATLGTAQFQVFGHRTDGVLVLELEKASTELPVEDLYSEVRATVSRLQNTKDLQAFFDLAVKEIRYLTGFDRVMAYEFLPDGSGHVISEAVEDGLECYLGHHYPASDIPQPARRMYSITWLRHLPDVDYVPVPLVPDLNPVTNGPLDLSYVASRHVSVMYSKYLQNMGVKATMVMTLLKNGKVWGLISCMHHDAPKHLPLEARMACEFLAHMVSLLMGTKEDVAVYEYKLKLKAISDQLVELAARKKSVCDGLMDSTPNLLDAIDATGAAAVCDGVVTTLGIAPDSAAIRELAEWLAQHDDPLFATDALSALFEPASVYKDIGSGVLAARLSRTGADYMMWFRPELAATINWAGDPTKPVEVVTVDNEARLLPRTSFALWKEEVRGRSAPWREFEIDGARNLRRALIETVVDRANELTRMNRQLERSNIELDSFAYVTSHDLKEPLRGIHNYAALLKRTATDRLTDEERSRLNTVLMLTQRMDSLIEDLLQYSRVGRIEFAARPVDLNEAIGGALDLLRSRIEQSGAIVEVARLPVVTGDRVRIREVFYNLILNGLKYNDSPQKRVEVGFEPGPVAVFYVRDNGIGIEPESFAEVFKMFRRLHGRDEYGGGTGAGLTITQKTVERHGGRIWVESIVGDGSTFYFTLAPPESPFAEAEQ